jgi:hypothetical protein
MSSFLDILDISTFHIALHHEIIPIAIVKQGPKMEPIRALTLATLALMLACAAARAEDGLHRSAGLGEHPAVLVARRGVSADPSGNFYLHPARLSWSLTRPLADGEHPAVLVAHRAPSSAIDPNQFIVGHPAGGAPPQRSQ